MCFVFFGFCWLYMWTFRFMLFHNDFCFVLIAVYIRFMSLFSCIIFSVFPWNFFLVVGKESKHHTEKTSIIAIENIKFAFFKGRAGYSWFSFLESEIYCITDIWVFFDVNLFFKTLFYYFSLVLFAFTV